ncbi:MAG TPA: C1 family peptidase [Alphaproteobacteria bacterium]|nr:C1 family peptidase [Alphaproteobacteria bacterium]
MPKPKRQKRKGARSPRARTLSRRQHYGWTPDDADARDHRYAPPRLGAVPAKFSLRDAFPAAYYQGQLKSCAANAVAAAIQYDRIKQGLPSGRVTPSRLFIYYNARAIEGRVAWNAPTRVRNVVKGVARYGACFEGRLADQWPYVIKRFKRRPRHLCFKAARKDRALHYSRVARDIEHFKACLASGYPFVFGFWAYEGIEARKVGKTGAIPLPKAHEKQLGGHVVLAVGYDDTKRHILIRNSWGTKWGKGGYGTMPYAYVLNPDLASDFWTIRVMSVSDGK